MAAAVKAIRKKRVRERREREEYGDEGPPMPIERRKPTASFKARARRERLDHFPVVEGFGRISPILGKIRWKQAEVCAMYNTPAVTWSVASVIIGNFLAIIVEKEIDPYDEQRFPGVWTWIDDISNSIFVLELIMNFYGSGTRRFWTSGWNIFDFIVVLVGFLTLIRVSRRPAILALPSLRNACGALVPTAR